MIRNNRIILDINKCTYATFYYRNQHGQCRYTLPKLITVRCEEIHPNLYAAAHPDYPCETELERVKRLSIEDVWTPEVMFKMHADTRIVFTGDKAKSMWELWKAKIFGE